MTRKQQKRKAAKLWAKIERQYEIEKAIKLLSHKKPKRCSGISARSKAGNSGAVTCGMIREMVGG